MADEIIFKCEDSMWQMLAEEGVTGIPTKPFDLRRHDMADDRIYRLSFGHLSPTAVEWGDNWGWEPDIDTVTFLNKATGETLTRDYRGMEFTKWAPGWCFLILGHRVGG